MIKLGKVLAGVGGFALATASVAQAVSPLEATFDRAISSTDQMAWLKILSSAPNHVGSPHDKANAEWLLAQYKSFGWDAHIETFSVLYPKPISTTVELIAPEPIKLGGQEPPVAGDDSTSDLSGALPPYVAYQGDGDVTAEVIYANYGMPDDYKALARMGVDVKGKIVIARYGGGWRGLKPKLAQDHGAAGSIIFSDPADDGYGRNDVYPKGGMRPPQSVQRGSVADMPIYPGDPLTPDVGATSGAKRLARADAKTLLKIPSLPMSYGDAQQILSRLGGRVVPGSWRGGLPFTYHVGGDGAVKVHLAVKSEWSQSPVYDVIATIKGKELPNEWVVRGNHHDGWVFGAADPLSGNVAMLDEAKAIGALLKTGWRPKRTIIYASWDGEEPGLLGSTEWAEEHAAELKAKAVIYINTDGNGRGTLGMEGSHDFQHFANQVAADVIDPETGATVAARRRALIRVAAFSKSSQFDAATVDAAEKRGDLPLGALGSGSDYSAYLQHLGLPALDIGFGGESQSGGVYHSAYDTYHHFTTFDDPGLKYGAALSKIVGRLVLRIADSDTPPMRFADFADTVARYLDEVKKLADGRRLGDRQEAKLLDSDAFRLAGDPTIPLANPVLEEPTGHPHIAALEDAVEHFQATATAFDSAYAAKGAKLTPAQRTKLNALLRTIDQILIDDRGLPGRPWYKNMIYAPGRFTGYGAKTLPGVREAIEERRFEDAGVYGLRIAKVLDAYSARLDQARAVIDGK
jgi:N-acetylated-alpha-linked acidic dipeptidase